ncbi:hypothetical protein GBAR_LOCUS27547 [Geodia barretti]|uniref:PH domain-containing protein n=2 Tax=Geodia barretti TaxID=519541 RepID=A0AA35XF42_GEOBA|nr:hypothetical protein GBAR_LOCUS27547 [Geodia barretti]
MATKKSVGTMQQQRNKEGLLELEKTKGLKKMWKAYMFKVSASTYLLCFKSDMSNPERKLLLAEVTRVLPSACHGASFPFEVHFRGKGSPWKLNAGSNEERISWMDAILPGSSSSVTRFQQSLSPPLMTDSSSSAQSSSLPPPYTPTNTTPSRKPGQHSASLGSDPRFRAAANPYMEVPKPASSASSSKDLLSDAEDDAFLTASLGAQTTPVSIHVPQNYLVPSVSPPPGTSEGSKTHAPPRHSSSDGQFVKPVPSPRPRPRPRPRASPAPEQGDDDYIKMMSLPIKKRTLQMTVSEGELPQYMEVVGDDSDPTLDEDNYVIPDSPLRSEKSSNSLRRGVGGVNSPQGAELRGGGASGNLVETISQHFNKEQIGMLIQMLQEVRVDERQTAGEEAKAWEVRSPSSPTTNSSEDSITLRGNLTRALSYAPNFSEGILVTDEDSDESYEKRPQWAKAVPANGNLPQHNEQQLDTLTNLQQEALYLLKNDIRDLRVIGHGQFRRGVQGGVAAARGGVNASGSEDDKEDDKRIPPAVVHEGDDHHVSDDAPQYRAAIRDCQ